MRFAARTLGPDDGTLLVKTYREGVAARAGHDLVLEVTRWEATLDETTVVLRVDSRSLEVREGLGGVKPLTDRDRAEIRETIDAKVLHGEPIEYRSSALRLDDDVLVVDGELVIRGRARPVTARLRGDDAGRLSGTIRIAQSEWGIKPYRGLMGALRVRDDVDVVIDVRLPPAG
jgi:polyisoprenoid-binding protein YceI